VLIPVADTFVAPSIQTSTIPSVKRHFTRATKSTQRPVIIGLSRYTVFVGEETLP
jgi:hypothetical protein